MWLTLLLKNKEFLTVGAIALLISAGSVYCTIQKNNLTNTIDNLRADIKTLTISNEDLKKSLVISGYQIDQLNESISFQNKQISDLEVENEKAVLELEEWKNKPSSIKYKTVYKTIYRDINKTGDECENIKLMLNNVNSISFGML